MLMTGTSWGLHAMKFVWHKMHQLWIEYTHYHHSPTTGPTPTQLCLLHRITHLQQSYLQIYPHHSHQFFLNEASMHTLPTGQLKNWLYLHKPIITAATKLQQNAEKLNQHLIHTFFPRKIS